MRKPRSDSPPPAKPRVSPAGKLELDPEQVLVRLRGHLQFLGLTHVLTDLDSLLDWSLRERPAHAVFLEHVLGREVASKTEGRIERRIHNSGLDERKTLEAYDFDFQPTVDKSFILELGRLGFVQRRDDLVITGQPGTGKSHFLKAFALRACQQAIRVRYARCVDLLDDLHAGLADNSYPRRLRAWTTPDLIIIDDVGLGQVRKRDDEPTAAHSLFNLIDRRHGRASTAVTSNIKLSEWGKYLGDATVAGAILDRLAMHGIRLDINGPSYRKHLADERAKNAGTPGLLDDIEA